MTMDYSQGGDTQWSRSITVIINAETYELTDIINALSN